MVKFKISTVLAGVLAVFSIAGTAMAADSPVNAGTTAYPLCSSFAKEITYHISQGTYILLNNYPIPTTAPNKKQLVDNFITAAAIAQKATDDPIQVGVCGPNETHKMGMASTELSKAVFALIAEAPIVSTENNVSNNLCKKEIYRSSSLIFNGNDALLMKYYVENPTDAQKRIAMRYSDMSANSLRETQPIYQSGCTSETLTTLTNINNILANFIQKM